MTSKIAVIQAGRPPKDLRDRAGEQADWFRSALHGLDAEIIVVRPFQGDNLPEAGSFSHAVITGSWSMVTDREEWSERTAAWIRQIISMNTPILGVCYGHQLMAHALGGTVGYHPMGRELGLHRVRLTSTTGRDPMLASMPGEFDAFLTHEQTVLVPPDEAIVLGRSDHDPHQILRYGPRAVSVQFHPEFTPEIMSFCIQRRRDKLVSEGFDVEAALSNLRPTVAARRLLAAFCSS